MKTSIEISDFLKEPSFQPSLMDQTLLSTAQLEIFFTYPEDFTSL